MSQVLLNKVAVVTGAGSGIGKAIAERFLIEGAKVLVFCRTRSSLEELATQAPARVLVVVGDVTSLADLGRRSNSAKYVYWCSVLESRGSRPSWKRRRN